LPVTFRESERWLDDFLENRFFDFGRYEDAMLLGGDVLHHSVLTTA
jgi:deoxyribodipyrimidine photolyase-related protein